MVAAVTVLRNGQAEMAYVGEKPWHGLGQQLTPGMPIEVWAREAGMAWKVQRSKVRYVCDERATLREWPERHVLFRNDTQAPLGMVSDGYKVVQPREVLEFFRDLTAANHMRLETAGTLHGGSRYWALAKTAHELRVAGTDLINGYLLLATSCDGSMATTGKFTSVRVVCQNTLTAALSSGKAAVTVRHATVFSDTKMKIELGVLDEAWASFGENARRLAVRKITQREALDVLLGVFGDPVRLAVDTAKDGREKALEAQPNVKLMGNIVQLFAGAGRGAQLASAKGTAWGLVNATTEYFDHVHGRNQDTRLTGAWFGVNEQRKRDVLTAALALAA